MIEQFAIQENDLLSETLLLLLGKLSSNGEVLADRLMQRYDVFST